MKKNNTSICIPGMWFEIRGGVAIIVERTLISEIKKRGHERDIYVGEEGERSGEEGSRKGWPSPDHPG